MNQHQQKAKRLRELLRATESAVRDLERLEQEAEPSPWFVSYPGAGTGSDRDSALRANAELVVAIRNSLPELLAMLRRLRVERNAALAAAESAGARYDLACDALRRAESRLETVRHDLPGIHKRIRVASDSAPPKLRRELRAIFDLLVGRVYGTVVADHSSAVGGAESRRRSSTAP